MRQADSAMILAQQQEQFAERYQDIVAKFYFAQAEHLRAVREGEALLQLVEQQRQLIELLLPHCPPELPQALSHQLELLRASQPQLTPVPVALSQANARWQPFP